MTDITTAGTVAAPGLSAQQGTEIRAVLCDVRRANEADLASAQAKLDALTAEGALTDASLREVVTSAEYMREDAHGILAMVDAAEQRLAAGRYGLCTTCGATIPWERLQLRSYSSTCVACS